MGLNMGKSESNEFWAADWSTIDRFQRGDETAFDDLMRRHRQRACNFASQLTKDRDEAADVVASTFGRVFRSLDRFRGESSFTSWLYRIELNCFLDIRKKAHSRATFRLDELLCGRDGLADLRVIGYRETAQEHIERGERISEIERAMNFLPPNQKKAFMMYQAESMSYEAVAQALDVPIGTVKSRLNRARLRIRKIMHIQQSQFPDQTPHRRAFAGKVPQPRA